MEHRRDERHDQARLHHADATRRDRYLPHDLDGEVRAGKLHDAHSQPEGVTDGDEAWQVGHQFPTANANVAAQSTGPGVGERLGSRHRDRHTECAEQLAMAGTHRRPARWNRPWTPATGTRHRAL